MDIFLKNNKILKLSEEQKNLCDKPITEKEILESIKNLATGKTPCSDGLPANFYKFFWIDIKSLLCNSIYYALILLCYLKKEKVDNFLKTGDL